MNSTIHTPTSAIIISRQQESKNVFSIGVRFTEDADLYQFLPGQFNMLYVLGLGEVAISVVRAAPEENIIYHTIRVVGRVTQALSQLKVGDSLGIRGPFGQGWPLSLAHSKDILIITGGLGCAPSVSAIHAIMEDRQHYGRLTILQGVKHSDDLIYREQYTKWQQAPNTQVLLAADFSAPGWPWHTGLITELIDQIQSKLNDTVCLLCGPEGMLLAAISILVKRGLPESMCYVNLERNMECGVGHCGHCQLGNVFLCKDGPVVNYSTVKPFFPRVGF